MFSIRVSGSCVRCTALAATSGAARGGCEGADRARCEGVKLGLSEMQDDKNKNKEGDEPRRGEEDVLEREDGREGRDIGSRGRAIKRDREVHTP